MFYLPSIVGVVNVYQTFLTSYIHCLSLAYVVFRHFDREGWQSEVIIDNT